MMRRLTTTALVALCTLGAAGTAQAATATAVYTDGTPAPGAQFCTGAGCTNQVDWYTGIRGTTGPDGQLVVNVPDGTVVEIRPHGQVAITTWAASSSVVVLPRVANEYTAPDTDAAEQLIVSLINARRAERGLPPVAIHPALSKGADFQATWITNHNGGVLSHDGPTGISQRAVESGFPTPGALNIGEVLYLNANPDPALAVGWWMTSSSHAQTILASDIRYAGAARVGNTWAVEVARQCTSPTRCGAITPPPVDPTVDPDPGDPITPPCQGCPGDDDDIARPRPCTPRFTMRARDEGRRVRVAIRSTCSMRGLHVVVRGRGKVLRRSALSGRAKGVYVSDRRDLARVEVKVYKGAKRIKKQLVRVPG